MSATPHHVIFGTGAIGVAVLEALRRRGETARLVNRSGTAPVPDDVEVIYQPPASPGPRSAAPQPFSSEPWRGQPHRAGAGRAAVRVPGRGRT